MSKLTSAALFALVACTASPLAHAATAPADVFSAMEPAEGAPTAAVQSVRPHTVQAAPAPIAAPMTAPINTATAPIARSAAPRSAAVVARPVVAIHQAAGVVPASAAVPTAPARLPMPRQLPDSALSYDPVPSDQVDALGQRLSLVQALIRRHGRAYDYRTHTVAELTTILIRLDASVTPAAVAVPAPRAAQAAVASDSDSLTLRALPVPNEEDEVSGGQGPRDEE